MEKYKFNKELLLIFLILFLGISNTAIWITKGRTVFVFSILFYPWLVKTILQSLPKISFKKILLIILFFLIFIILFDFRFYHQGHFSPIYEGYDKAFNAQTAAFIKYSGTESFYLDYTGLKNQVVLPYHYGDIYTNILLSSILPWNEFFTQELIVVPFLLAFTLLMLYSFFISYVSPLLAFVIAFFLIFFRGDNIFNFMILPLLYNFCSIQMVPTFLVLKLSFNFLLISFILFLYSQEGMGKNWLYGVSLVFYLNFLFWPILILTIIPLFYKYRKINIDLILVSLSVLFYSVFYLFYGFKGANVNPLNTMSIFHCMSLSLYMKNMLSIIFKAVLQLITLLLPYLLISLLFIKFINIVQKHKNGQPFLYIKTIISSCSFRKLLFWSSVWMLSLIFWALLWINSVSVELYLDGIGQFMKILLIVYIIKLSLTVIKFRLYQWLYFLLLITISMNDLYSQAKDFVTVPKSNSLDKNDKILLSPHPFVYLRFYEPKSEFHKNLLYLSSVSKISLVNSFNQGVSYELNNIQRSSNCVEAYREKQFIESSPFYLFLKKNYMLNDSMLINQFVYSLNITWLISDIPIDNIKNQLKYTKYLSFDKKNIGFLSKYYVYKIISPKLQ